MIVHWLRNTRCHQQCCYGGRNLQLGRWQCFFDMPPRWQWQISVLVKARVVNWKQVDVAASRPFDLFGNALIAHCMQRDCGGALSETVAMVSLSTVARLFLLWQSYRLRVGSGHVGEGGRCRRLILPCVHTGMKWRCGSDGQFSGNRAQKDSWEHCKTLRWRCWFGGS